MIPWYWPVLIMFALIFFGLMIWWRHRALHQKALVKLRGQFPETEQALLCAVVVGQERAPAIAALLSDRIVVQQPAKDQTLLHMPFDCFTCQQAEKPGDGKSALGLSVLTFEASLYKIELLLPAEIANHWYQRWHAAEADDQ